MPITHHRVPITVKVDRAALHGVVCADSRAGAA
jgi:hypothetical protein